MADQTGIEWADATVNFWWGCTKVGPGCDHCYAERLANRFGTSWGQGMPRRQIKGASDTLARLNRQGGKRVFIQSMSDLFDTEVRVHWFAEAWEGIQRATACRIQIVTKRISMVEKRLSQVGIGVGMWPRHAGLMITVCNQAEADRDIPRLLALKAKFGIPWVGLSMEPLLGPVDLTAISAWDYPVLNALTGYDKRSGETRPALDWVIVGGESGPKARPMHSDWARCLRDQCAAAGVAYFFKQWGEWAPRFVAGVQETDPPSNTTARAQWHDACGLICDTLAKPDPLSFFSGGAVYRVGKSRAGRLLDGQEHNAMPEVR